MMQKENKWILKRIDWKLVNFAVYVEIIISYFLPYKIVDECIYKVGFPIPFLEVYEKPIIHINPFLSMHLNYFSLIANIVIIYYVTALLIKLYKKMKSMA